jgi:hypothetical protein
MHCLDHCIHLIVQKVLCVASEADNPDVNNYFTMHKDFPIDIKAPGEKEGEDNCIQAMCPLDMPQGLSQVYGNL